MSAREIWSALAVLVFVALVWWFIQWRSAPPPPPKRAMPGETAAPLPAAK